MQMTMKAQKGIRLIALDGGGWSKPRSDSFTPGEPGTQYIGRW